MGEKRDSFVCVSPVSERSPSQELLADFALGFNARNQVTCANKTLLCKKQQDCYDCLGQPLFYSRVGHVTPKLQWTSAVIGEVQMVVY